MLLTSNFGLKKPEETDPVDVHDFNDNADIIDQELQKRPKSDGNASNMTVEFSAATQLAEITSKDTLKGLFAKLALTVKNVITLIDAVNNIGTYYNASNSNIKVGTSNTLLTSKSLAAGTYVVVGEFYIPSGYSGEMNCMLATASASGSVFATTRIQKSTTSGSSRMQTTGVVKLSATTNICVVAKTATSVSECEGVLRAVRVK